MADTVNEIGEIVKKCKILLLDIEGTTTSITFVKDKLFPYAEEHVKQFLTEKWENNDVKEAVAALRLLASKDQEASVDGVVSIPGEDTSKDEQIEAFVNSVKWQMSLDRKSTALKHLQGLIWKQGYDNGDIKGHVYDDVPAALENWHSVDGRKVYIYSSGSVQAQKLLFGQSSAGDLRASIDGHFDTAVGAKQEASSYIAIAEKIGCKPEDILFLTDIEKEAEAARAAGLHAALVSREGNAPLADSAVAYPLIRSLAQLVVTNKRKQDIETQEENPAKVAKTITQDDTKLTSSEEQTAKTGDAPDSMEVETEPAAVQEPSKEKEADTKTGKMQVETVVEEIIDPDDKIDVPVSEVEPIVIESQIEKPVEVCEKVQTEDVGVASDDVEITDERPKKETEVTKPIVLMEIEEIAPDKPTVDEVAEIIEDLEPVVEEPDLETAGVDDSDLDNLKNVGQVLEKECDEILSKVQDVTNLDNITIKPMLNTITEENTENDITDSDDIVDRILDTELEFEMKQIHGNGDGKASKVESSENEVASSVADVEPSAVDVQSSVSDVKAVADAESSATDAQPSKSKVESSTTDVETSVTNVKPASAVDVKGSADAEPLVADSEPAVVDVNVGDGVTPADGDAKSPHEKSESVSEEKITVTNNEEATATNGVVAPASLNGDDLSSRLAMENGAQSKDSTVNGADSTEVSLNGAGDGPDVPAADAGQPDPATADIKVKAVPAEEKHTDQTTEA